MTYPALRFPWRSLRYLPFAAALALCLVATGTAWASSPYAVAAAMMETTIEHTIKTVSRRAADMMVSWRQPKVR